MRKRCGRKWKQNQIINFFYSFCNKFFVCTFSILIQIKLRQDNVDNTTLSISRNIPLVGSIQGSREWRNKEVVGSIQIKLRQENVDNTTL